MTKLNVFFAAFFCFCSVASAQVPKPVYKYFDAKKYADGKNRGKIFIERRGKRIEVADTTALSENLREDDIVRFTKGLILFKPASLMKNDITLQGEGPETVLVDEKLLENPDQPVRSMEISGGIGILVKDLTLVNANISTPGLQYSGLSRGFAVLENVISDGYLTIERPQNVLITFSIINNFPNFIQGDKYDLRPMLFGTMIRNGGQGEFEMPNDLHRMRIVHSFIEGLKEARSDGQMKSPPNNLVRPAYQELEKSHYSEYHYLVEQDFNRKFMREYLISSLAKNFDMKKAVNDELKVSLEKGLDELKKGHPLSALLYASRIPKDAPTDAKKKQSDLFEKVRKDFGSKYNPCRIKYSYAKSYQHSSKNEGIVYRGPSYANDVVLSYPVMALYDPKTVNCEIEFVISQDKYLTKIDNSKQEKTFTVAFDAEGAYRQAQAQAAAFQAGVQGFQASMNALNDNITKNWNNFYNYRVRFEDHVGGKDLVSYRGNKNVGMSDFSNMAIKSAQDRAAEQSAAAAAEGNGMKKFETLTVTYRQYAQSHIEGVAFLRRKGQKEKSVPLPSFVWEAMQAQCKVEYGTNKDTGNVDFTHVIHEIGTPENDCPKKLEPPFPSYAYNFTKSVVTPIILNYISDYVIPPVAKTLEKARSAKSEGDLAEAQLFILAFGGKLSDDEKSKLKTYYSASNIEQDFKDAVSMAQQRGN